MVDRSKKSFWDDLSTWNVIMVVIMITGFYATSISFRTHVTDFEKMTTSNIEELKEDRDEDRLRLREVELKNNRMETELKHIHKGIDEISKKLDKLIVP